MPVDLRHEARCPDCGRLAIKKLSLFSFTFGWRLTQESHHIKGYPDTIEKAI